MKYLFVSDHSEQEMHHTSLPVQTLLQVLFKHILIYLTSFIGIVN
jgi:hypothetical protein